MKKSNVKVSQTLILLASAGLLGFTNVVFADIYRCDNAPGVITLSNIPKDKQRCKKMDLPPPDRRLKSNPAPANSASSPKAGDVASSKAAKNKSSYENAQGERKRIIQEELDLEQDRLDSVNAKISALNTASNKSPNRVKDVTALQKKQSLHQANIELLQKELNKQ